jgi:multiple sugar transport system substrate-binding protein
MRFMRRVWSLALIFGLLGLALASVSEAGQFNWQQFKGTQLRVLINKHPWQAAIEPHLKDFEALTGMKLVVEVYPEDQFRAKTLVELTSGASSMDVFMTMPGQEGLKYMRAGWYQPVDEFLKDPSLTAADYGWNDFLDKARDAMVIEGKTIGPPIQIENSALMYRKDVFQKYNVKVPTTLDELEAAAKALNGKAMTDDGQPGFGFVARGKRAAATSQFAGMLYAMGGTWLKPNREPAINSPEAVKAIDM